MTHQQINKRYFNQFLKNRIKIIARLGWRNEKATTPKVITMKNKS